MTTSPTPWNIHQETVQSESFVVVIKDRNGKSVGFMHEWADAELLVNSVNGADAEKDAEIKKLEGDIVDLEGKIVVLEGRLNEKEKAQKDKTV